MKRKRKGRVGIEFGLNNDETGAHFKTLEFNLLRTLEGYRRHSAQSGSDYKSGWVYNMNTNIRSM